MAEASRRFAPLVGYTRGDINRAGVELRRWWLSDEEIDRDVSLAIEAMTTFREAFQVPLKKTVMGLRSMVRSECPQLQDPRARLPVAQRPKREVQIINKLARLPSMELWTMGDIGGCRAVLPGREQWTVCCGEFARTGMCMGGSAIVVTRLPRAATGLFTSS